MSWATFTSLYIYIYIYQLWKWDMRRWRKGNKESSFFFFVLSPWIAAQAGHKLQGLAKIEKKTHNPNPTVKE